MDKTSKQNSEILFKTKKVSYKLAVIMAFIAFATILFALANNLHGIKLVEIILAIIGGALTFGIFGGLLSQDEFNITGDILTYGKESVDLSKLEEVSDVHSMLRNWTPGSYLTNFYLKLKDRNNNMVLLNLGAWEKQKDFLIIVARYINSTGAIVDNRAAKLINNAIKSKH